MRGSGIFHAKFATHVRPTVETAMTDRIEIYKPTGERSHWTPGANGGNMDNNAFELVYRGQARLQPDINWRARDRNFANELTGTAAVFVQIPVRGNELRPDGILPLIAKDFKVVYLSGTAEENGWKGDAPMIVRNAVQATEKWLRTFVVDVGTRAN